MAGQILLEAKEIVMKEIIMLCVLGSLSLGASAFDIGFERGSTIKTDEIDGYVSVNCEERGQSRWYSYSCYDIALVGGAYGKIKVTNGSVDADWVKLRREGSNHIKGAAFNATEQQTGRNFNLWISTLFQKPLLEKGKNLVNFTFEKQGQLVSQGQFEVEIIEGEYRSCPRGTLYYYSACPTINTACSDYFRRYNYCR